MLTRVYLKIMYYYNLVVFRDSDALNLDLFVNVISGEISKSFLT